MGEHKGHHAAADMLSLGRPEPGSIDSDASSNTRSGPYDASKRQTVEHQCRIPFSSIEYITPCTPLQETLMAATMRRPGVYVQKRTFHIKREVNLDRLEACWHTLVSSTPILRTRMVWLDDGAFSLAVVKEKIEWILGDSPSAYSNEELQRKFEPGRRLTWVALMQRADGDGHYLIWNIHHSLYDAWSFDLMLGHLEHLYNPVDGFEPPVSFTDLIQHTINCGSETSLEFWKDQLHGAICKHFPVVPTPYIPTPDSVDTYHFDDVSWAKMPWSKDIVIRAALSLLLANRTGQDDVIFGVVSAGRKAPVQGVKRMAFPALATVPLRNRVSRLLTLRDFLQQLRDQRRSMYAHEHTGLQRIRRLGNDEAHCCSFQSLLVVQSGQESRSEQSVLVPADGSNRRADRLLDFASSALTFECEPKVTGLVLHVSYDSNVITSESAARLCCQLGHVVQVLCKLGGRKPEVLLADIPMLSPRDLSDIWQWNPAPPVLLERFLDDLVLEVAAQAPHAQAVEAWDGKLKYCELAELSKKLADTLVEAGLGRGCVIAICSQKSKWIPVAILGVLRSGAAFVTFDSSAPSRRVATILTKTDAKYLLTASLDSLPELPDGVTCIDLCGLPTSECASPQLRSSRGSTSDAAYICFTSGSTGEPKGIVVQHTAATTNLSANAEVYGLSATTRTLCYSSLAFDGFMFEIFCTLFRGGCLCIPSQEQIIIDALPEFMRSFGVNTAFLTPAVLRQYSPADLPTIQTLLCGGEAVGEDVAGLWASKVKFFCVYGPTETVVMSLAYLVRTYDHGPPPIGRGIAARTWVVDPDNDDVLQTVGAIGELLVEGHTLAQGYLDDQDRTDAAFLNDPPWLLRGAIGGGGGRSGRVYKTGDLVRYREDGSLEFCGRADTQVKIRGQRVELAEIEVQTRCSIPTDLVKAISVEYTPPRDGTNKILLAFIVLADDVLSEGHASQEAVAHAHRGLAQRLPSYMIPTHFVVTSSIPTTVSGKVDRKTLQTLAMSIALTDMLPMSSNKSSNTAVGANLPTSAMEKKMQELWSLVVEQAESTIKTEHTFLDVGGDSILAMRLVGLARQHGIQLRTSDILQHQTLAEIARTAVRLDPASRGMDGIAPFSLLTSISGTQDDLKNELADLCSVKPTQILDAYSCTPFQERVMTLDSAIRDSLVAHFIHRLDTGVDIDTLHRAVDAEQKINPLLRTRIVQRSGMGTLQVVVNTSQACQVFPNPETFAKHLPLQHVDLGTPLSTFCIIKDQGTAYLALIAHHAVFDGWSISLLLKRICSTYALTTNATPDRPPQFQNYIRYLARIEKDVDKRFWEAQMKGCTGRCFPVVPESVKHLNVSSVMTHVIDNINWPSHNTPAANVRATLAILYAAFSNSSEALFCEAFTGRSTPVAGVESMTGPTLGTVPMRIILSPEENVQDFVDRMARQAIEVGLHAHCSRAQIREFNDDTDRGCNFTSFVIIQPARAAGSDDGRIIKERTVLCGIGGRQPLHLNPFLLEVDLRPRGVNLTLRSDERVLSGARCEKFGEQFEQVLRQLIAPENRLARQASLDMGWLD